MKRSVPFAAALLAASIAAPLGAPAAGANSPAKKPQPTVTVLVTNDDGVNAPGIDAVVEALRTQKKTKVVVVAPAQNWSGVGGRYTPEGVTAEKATTASGYAAYAVAGYPSDTIDYALDVLKLEPDFVISGANSTQNLSESVVAVSGTVGAARQAARRGIPALAVSQGQGSPDYPAGATLAVDWLRRQRRALKGNKATTGPLATIDSLNVPNCPGGPRGVAETGVAPEGTPDVLRTEVDCTSTQTTFAHDVDAFNHGYASLAKVSVPAERG